MQKDVYELTRIVANYDHVLLDVSDATGQLLHNHEFRTWPKYLRQVSSLIDRGWVVPFDINQAARNHCNNNGVITASRAAKITIGHIKSLAKPSQLSDEERIIARIFKIYFKDVDIFRNHDSWKFRRFLSESAALAAEGSVAVVTNCVRLAYGLRKVLQDSHLPEYGILPIYNRIDVFSRRKDGFEFNRVELAYEVKKSIPEMRYNGPLKQELITYHEPEPPKEPFMHAERSGLTYVA